jgi:putative ABC transport system substrate-binding protein
MTARRFVLCALAAATFLAPLRARSQSKPKRIGSLALDEGALARQDEVFKGRLRELGWIEGKNLAIEYRFAKPDQIHAMAEELVARKVDLIVVWSTVVALAAKKATTSIPIVMARVADPVGAGLVASLARPGGNITGMSLNLPEVAGKRVELLSDAFPGIKRVAFLGSSADPATKVFVANTEQAARKLGMSVSVELVKGSDEFAAAFARIAAANAQAVIVQPIFWRLAQPIVDLALKYRLPTVSDFEVFARDGGLLSYGPKRSANWTIVVDYVDRIFKGAKPGDLPIQEPTRFALVVNLRTAKALGVTIPPFVLDRADEVIR